VAGRKPHESHQPLALAKMSWWRELFRLMLDVASGKQTWAEHWKIHNSLALFNPAPVT